MTNGTLGRGTVLRILLIAFFALSSPGSAQDEYRQPIWKFGLNAGLNLNFAGAGYQNLAPPGNTSIGNFIPLEVNDGSGVGLYGGLLAEYNSDSWWGAQLRLSYDMRNAVVNDASFTPEKEFDANFSYFTIEPLLRIYPEITPGLHFTAGPLIGINLTGEYDYKPDKDGPATATGVEFPELSSLTLGISAGVGYDILLNDRREETWFYLTPYLEGSWMVNQRGTSFEDLDQNSIDDIWSTVTLRAGVHFMFGAAPPVELVEIDASNPLINLSLLTPTGGIIRSRKVEEYFPLVANVFFDSNSTAIPGRYVQLDQGDAGDFSENDLLDEDEIGNLTERQRSQRQMNTYYNVMNIIGARMRDNPEQKVTLIGSGGDKDDGHILAENVKSYLTNSFGIDPDRISIKSQKLPRRPSGSAGTPKEDRPLVDEENRRVEFVTNNDILLQPVRMRLVQNNPIDNDLVLAVDEGGGIKSWQVKLEGEGRNFNFGPFRRASQRINPGDLMKDIEQGRYTAEVIVTTNDDQVLRERREFDLVVRADTGEGARRYSIVFEYGQKDAVKTYDRFLRNVVAAQTQQGQKVIIHGYTDNVGDADGNFRLSQKRARETADVLRDELRKLGRRVKIESVGFGEDGTRPLFDNSLPEGRFYNRTVVIEIIEAS